jgi:hypothetical protein
MTGLLNSAGGAQGLHIDPLAQLFGQEVRLFERLPRLGGTFRRLDGDGPQRAGGNAGRLGEASHLVLRDLGETAAAAETQSELVAGNVGEGRDEIVCRREHGPARVRIEERPVSSGACRRCRWPR